MGLLSRRYTNSVAASERRQFLSDIRQVLTSPKEFTLDDETGDAKHAGGFCGHADSIVFDPARTC